MQLKGDYDKSFSSVKFSILPDFQKCTSILSFDFSNVNIITNVETKQGHYVVDRVEKYFVLCIINVNTVNNEVTAVGQFANTVQPEVFVENVREVLFVHMIKDEVIVNIVRQSLSESRKAFRAFISSITRLLEPVALVSSITL
jgi:hypothetical protein